MAGLLSRILLIVVVAPVVAILRFIVRPLLLAVYRASFPMHLWVQRRFAAAKNRFLFPLTTRSVIHAVIIVTTVIVSTNSLAAKEVRQTEGTSNTLLARIVSPDSAEEALTYVATATPVSFEAGAELTVAELAEGTDGTTEGDPEFVTDVSALSPDTITETTPAGQPRESIERYTVQGGDTISGIAEQFAITQRSIRWANNLASTDFIKPGQVLTIPPVSGVLHQVKKGETVQAIASKYKANFEQILEFNRLAAAEAVQTGQTLVVPGGEIEPPPTPVATPRVANSAPAARASVSAETPPPSARNTRGSGFLWPTVSHRVNQGFKAYAHRALDIEGDMGTPVYASEDGVVEGVKFERYGYGYHVIVNHGGGIKTLYAHAGKIYVRPGQRVERGQTIMAIGMTGRTTGPHVHYEVFNGGVKVNPYNYLR